MPPNSSHKRKRMIRRTITWSHYGSVRIQKAHEVSRKTIPVPSNFGSFVLQALFLATVVNLFTTSSAYPWGSKGHEIVAAIAETHLATITRKRIKELLPQGTTLAEASTWPDGPGRKIPDMDPYHFINFPKDANAYDQQRDCKLRNCIIEAIAWYMQVLKSPDAPRNEKRTALRFIAHLVGDIHQPLHAGFAEDRGGNSVDVRFDGRKENLHSLWDTALVELEQGSPTEIAARIQAGVTGDDHRQGGTPAE